MSKTKTSPESEAAATAGALDGVDTLKSMEDILKASAADVARPRVYSDADGLKTEADFDEPDDGEEETGDDGFGIFARDSLNGAPPPRPGFVQKFVRLHVAGKPDARHMAQQISQFGWAPRQLETIPLEQRRGFAFTNGGNLGTVLTSGDLVLCEMPAALAEKRKRYFNQKRKNLENVVVDEIEANNRKSTAANGFGNIAVVQNATRRTHLRRPVVGAD